jgi:hypothetical protein
LKLALYNMPEISPELKALVFTLATLRFILRRQQGEDTTVAYNPTAATGSSTSIPLSTNYIDNLLIAYSLEPTASIPTNNNSLCTIPEQPMEDEKTPKNKNQELPK